MTDDKVKATESCIILEEKIRNLGEDIGVWYIKNKTNNYRNVK